MPPESTTSSTQPPSQQTPIPPPPPPPEPFRYIMTFAAGLAIGVQIGYMVVSSGMVR